jgi:hypothetical protein
MGYSGLHEGPGYLVRPMSEVWHPQLQFVNQQKIISTFPPVLRIAPDGEMDYFILGSTLLVFAALIQAVITSNMAGRGKTAFARRYDIHCRLIFPILFFGITIYSFIL